MTSAPVVEPGPPPPAPTQRPPRGDRFFAWTSDLGLVRTDGWLGGVAAGLAARLRIDPLIVRGILVVVGLFGLPVLFLYGIAWALLPDTDGRIPLQDALRRDVTAGFVGAAIATLLGLVPPPLVVSFVFTGGLYGGGWSVVAMVVTALALLIAGGLILLIVRAAVRAPGVAVPGKGMASSSPETPVLSDVDDSSGGDDDADERGVDADGDAPEASAPALDSAGDMAAWREQHAAWREQDQEWRKQQQDAARAARDQARRERQARAAEFAAEAAERRRVRRLLHPRTPFAFVAVTLGVAVVAGTLVALQHGGEYAAAVGLFVAAVVVALAMVIAGLARRRSGFLAFVAGLTLVAGIVATAVPTMLSLHVGSYGISNTSGERYPASRPFVQPWGDLSVYFDDTGDGGETSVIKRAGATFISVEPGVALELDVSTSRGALYFSSSDQPVAEYLPNMPGVTGTALPDGSMRYTGTLVNGDAPTTTERMVLDQETGYIEVYFLEPATDETETDSE